MSSFPDSDTSYRTYFLLIETSGIRTTTGFCFWDFPKNGLKYLIRNIIGRVLSLKSCDILDIFSHISKVHTPRAFRTSLCQLQPLLNNQCNLEVVSARLRRLTHAVYTKYTALDFGMGSWLGTFLHKLGPRTHIYYI